MHLKHTIIFATIAAIVLAVGCGSTKKSTLPSLRGEKTPFIRITEAARWDLLFAAIQREPTPTNEIVASEIKRQRVFGTLTLDKGDLYIPQLADHKDLKSIITIDSGVDEWALVEAAVWDEVRHTVIVCAGFIPLSEYQNYLATLPKGENHNEN